MSTLSTPPTRPGLAEADGPSNVNGDAAHRRNGHQPRPAKRRAVLPWIVGGTVVVALIAGLAVVASGRMGQGSGVDRLTVPVAQGPLVVSVTESGTIKAAQQEIIKSQIEGRTQILYLIPEGRQVQRGELLVELDVTSLRDDRVDREISVQNAEAAFIRAEENLAVTRNQSEADVARARLDYQFAEQDLKKYLQADFPKQEMEARNRITIADEELQRAVDRYDGSLRLHNEQFISNSELQADELARTRAQINRDVAKRELELLLEFDHPRRRAELESNLEQSRMALERTERRARAEVIQAEADLRARRSELERQQDRLQRIEDQIGRAKIYAPRSGLVVYATTGQGGMRGNQEPLEEGQEVRERQDLIYLPTATDMIAEIKIHESALDKVRVGMPVQVSVDALTGRRYWGEITRIAPLPDAQSMWMNPDLKVYNTEIRIFDNGPEIRTGMSCRAEIIVETFNNATYVPLQSVVRINGEPTAFVVDDQGVTRQRKVEIGPDDNRMVVIKAGLEPGERVLLTPPLGDTATSRSLSLDDVPQERRQQARDAHQNPPVLPADEADLPRVPDEFQPGQMMPGGEQRTQRRGGGSDAMRQAMQQLNERMSEEERERMSEYRQNQDMAGMMRFGQEMAEKYGIEMPAPGAPGGAGRGGPEMRRPSGERDEVPADAAPEARDDAAGEPSGDAGEQQPAATGDQSK